MDSEHLISEEGNVNMSRNSAANTEVEVFTNPPEGTPIHPKFEVFGFIKRYPILKGDVKAANCHLNVQIIGALLQMFVNASAYPSFLGVEYTTPLLKAKELCLLPLAGLSFLIQTLMFIAACMARADSKLLCSRQWDKRIYCIQMVLTVPQLVCLFNILMVYFWEKTLDASDFEGGAPGPQESLLDVVYTVVMVMSGLVFTLILLVILYVLAYQSKFKADKELISSKLLALKPMKYAALPEGEAPKYCGLCFQAFEKLNDIVRVQCKGGHVFHRRCLQKQLELRDLLGEFNSCCLCKGKLVFSPLLG